MNPTPSLVIGALCLLAGAAPFAHAGALRADHPLVGTWRLDVKALSCHETYSIRADGTTLVTSAKEVARSEIVVSDQPSAAGFYQWVDTVVQDNGQPDCAGGVTAVGHQATNYIRLRPDGQMFVMCEQESLDACIGPFVRMAGTES